MENRNEETQNTIEIKLDEEIKNTVDINETEKPQPKGSDCCHSEKKCNHTMCMCIFNTVLLVGLILIYIFHFTGIGTHSKTNPDAKAAVVPENGVLKVAYVNSDSLLAKYQYAIDLENELKAFRESKENSYKQQMMQFQNDYQQYLKTGDQLTLSQQQAKEAELKQRSEKLQNMQSEFAMQIQEKLAKENEKMLNAIFAFVREYNEANQQFDIILRKTMTESPTLYVNPAMDITDEIIKGLNEEYAQVKKNEK